MNSAMWTTLLFSINAVVFVAMMVVTLWHLQWLSRCRRSMTYVFQYALANSALVTLRQGGIHWRQTFYSLEILRTGSVR